MQALVKREIKNSEHTTTPYGFSFVFASLNNMVVITFNFLKTRFSLDFYQLLLNIHVYESKSYCSETENGLLTGFKQASEFVEDDNFCL